MIITVKNESPFQILTGAFTIGPSPTGYELQVGATPESFTTLFSVGANTPRMVTNVANGSYYRLKNNTGDVQVNWSRTCVTEGGSGGSGGTTYTAGDYIDLTGDVISVTGITPDAYLTSADTEDLATKQYVQDALSGVDLSNYYTSAQTDAAISAATSGKADAANVTANTTMKFPLWNGQGVITGTTGNNLTRTGFFLNGTPRYLIKEATSGDLGDAYAPTTPGTAGDILVSAGNGAPVWSAVTMGGNSNILPAITTQAEYEAISGDVKTGDLIQVRDVDINGDGDNEYGLFEAGVQEEEEPGGDIIRIINWERKDNAYSVTWSDEDYPWMPQNGIEPIEFLPNGFIISSDLTADEAYNGIGFDDDGKPIITHFAPEYDEETGEVTGITREDTPIGGGADMSAYYTSAQTEDAISAATAGKADAANVSANTNTFLFPYWNEQGIITGSDYRGVSQIPFGVNGVKIDFYAGGGSADLPDFYAPLSAGTAGQILVSTGNGAPVWSAVTIPDTSLFVTSAQVETQIVGKHYTTSSDQSILNIIRIEQSDYDALVSQSATTSTTLYVVVPDSE